MIYLPLITQGIHSGGDKYYINPFSPFNKQLFVMKWFKEFKK